jgi:hypothetical protein
VATEVEEAGLVSVQTRAEDSLSPCRASLGWVRNCGTRRSDSFCRALLCLSPVWETAVGAEPLGEVERVAAAVDSTAAAHFRQWEGDFDQFYDLCGCGAFGSKNSMSLIPLW